MTKTQTKKMLVIETSVALRREAERNGETPSWSRALMILSELCDARKCYSDWADGVSDRTFRRLANEALREMD